MWQRFLYPIFQRGWDGYSWKHLPKSVQATDILPSLTFSLISKVRRRSLSIRPCGADLHARPHSGLFSLELLRNRTMLRTGSVCVRSPYGNGYSCLPSDLGSS